MHSHPTLPVLLLLAGLVACDEPGPTSPQWSELDEIVSLDRAMVHQRGTYDRLGPIKVMTWNVYVGADVDVILGATDPQQIPMLAAQAFQVLRSTDFTERADAIAKQVGKIKPHLIGLQEVSLLRIQSPGDAAFRGTAAAETVFQDYLEILMAAFRARGLRYYVAGIVENVDAEVPMWTGADPIPFGDIRLTDYDVVLARHDVETSDVEAVTYATNLKVPALGLMVKRGYVAVTAKLREGDLRFVNTHLEPVSSGDHIQHAQAQELLAALQGETRPTILVGDLNTRGPDAQTYAAFVDAGFTDVWAVKRNKAERNPEGYTSNHDADLRNDVVDLHERIDYILARPEAGRTVRAHAIVVGDELNDRTASGLWPSDHAGIVAKLKTVARR